MLLEPTSTPTQLIAGNVLQAGVELPVEPSHSCVLGVVASVGPQMWKETEPVNEPFSPVTVTAAESLTVTDASAGSAGSVRPPAGIAVPDPSCGVVTVEELHSPSCSATKSNSVAVIVFDERVSGTTVLKQLGAASPADWNTLLRLMPPSKKSGETTLFLPTPPVASEVSHGVAAGQLAFVVAQRESVPPATLQSASELKMGLPLQPFSAGVTPGAFVFGSGQSCESMQPPSPAN